MYSATKTTSTSFSCTLAKTGYHGGAFSGQKNKFPTQPSLRLALEQLWRVRYIKPTTMYKTNNIFPHQHQQLDRTGNLGTTHMETATTMTFKQFNQRRSLSGTCWRTQLYHGSQLSRGKELNNSLVEGVDGCAAARENSGIDTELHEHCLHRFNFSGIVGSTGVC